MTQNSPTVSSEYVERGHHWREKKTRSVGPYGGKAVLEWECRGCGTVSRSRDQVMDPCPSPTIWVKMGTPGDGVGRCRECDALFVFERPVSPPHDHPCPECGNVAWYRTDDTEASPEEVLTDVQV